MVARVVTRRGSGAVTWLMSDHLSSTSVSYDGTIALHQGYKPWGETRFGDSGIRYQFTGQARGPSFGLDFFEARWYDSRLGRFVEADNIIPEASQGTQAWDRYAYTNNNPVKYNDPSGHDVGCSAADPSCENQNTYTPAVMFPNDPYSDPEYSTWRRLREGSKCTACHVTHDGYMDDGRIPDNSQLDPGLVEYYRSLDLLAKLVHSTVLQQAASLGSASISSVPKYCRYCSNAEAQAIQETGILRGGRPGTTYFTQDTYATASEAQQSLALPSRPDVRVDFIIQNSPEINGPSIVSPSFG